MTAENLFEHFFQKIYKTVARFEKIHYLCQCFLKNKQPSQELNKLLNMSVLTSGQTIGSYRIQSLIKQNEYTETYKAVNENDNPYFLKLYILKTTPAKIIDADSHEVTEIVLLRKMKHPNLVSYITDGKITTDYGECHYVVTNYFTGEVLADKISREGKISPEKAMEIFSGIIDGLKALHDANICHNDITPSNIMLSDSMNGVPEIIDMGHASKACKGTIPFDVMDLDVRYCASANSAGIFDERTDIFSAFCVLYTMLTGCAPWESIDIMSSTFAQTMLKMKRLRIDNPIDVNTLPIDDKLKFIIGKGLSVNINSGYQNIDELRTDLKGETPQNRSHEGRSQSGGRSQSNPSQKQEEDPTAIDVVTKKGNGHGFDDIAGMHDLKEMLQQKVIFVLQNKELAEEYKLTPPNGMLLYGPPGCGKTFFAEKFAEQTAFNFILVKSSDLASVYVHGSQEKIGKLFKQAEEQAPTVLCFDEFDAFVPNRSAPGSSYVSSEVNEFLSQLNNCSSRGIFVVATTNRPDMIDPAILRTGRLDKQIYVPLPDHDARREMFSLYLKGRPFEETAMDLDKLSDLTEGYIASDIAFIVNDAAMTAAFTHAKITQELIEKTIHETRPSISQELMQSYEFLRAKMEGVERSNALPRIGFKK